MGFSLELVRTVCTHVGADRAQVINMLLKATSIHEALPGHSFDNIVGAVQLMDDAEKARAFLQGSEQLAGMGFSSERVREAMIVTDTDLEKALDYLSA